MSSIQPGNTSEWQLYRVLQRSNLLQYYDTFIAQGGDDVQQLCEAGEEEFLEIMALVGMASKPLHVRRLQKALQEWVQNPAAFQSPVQPSSSILGPQTVNSTPTLVSSALSRPEPSQPVYPTPAPSSTNSTSPLWTPSVSPGPAVTVSPENDSKNNSSSCLTPIDPNSSEKQQKSTSPVPTPVLVESQINAIAEAAARLAKELPPFEMKKLNMKKQVNKEIMQLIQNSSDDDPNKMDQLRKYAAIYGRFDSKRKSEKPMSLHEISVNEAAAQLCRHMSTLLTRREDLFPLARQVVKDSGYHYSKGHSRASDMLTLPSTKRIDMMYGGSNYLRKYKLDSGFIQMYMNLCEANPGMVKNPEDSEKLSRLTAELTVTTQNQEMLKAQLAIAKENNHTELMQTLQAQLDQVTGRQLQLYTEQSEIIRKQRQAQMGVAFDDDTGSDFPSGASSPNNSGDGEEFNQQIRQHLYSSGEVLKSKPAMQNTLFDEGMRIAQQFGLNDFAQELKGMADTSPDEETKDITEAIKRRASELFENGVSKSAHSDESSANKKAKLSVNGDEGKEEEDVSGES